MSIRVGLVGLRRGRGLLAVLSHHPAAEVIAVCDLNPETLGREAKTYDVPHRTPHFEDLLNFDLDLVVVATPPQFHVAQSCAALEAGCHVLSEVPAVETLAEGERLARTVERTGRKYMMAENVNWFPRTLAWKRALDEGRLGTIFYAEAEYIHNCHDLMRHPDGSPTWRAHMPPLHYCTHSLGPLLAWTGDRCVSVTGFHTGCHLLPEFGTLDLEVGLMQTASGAVFKVLCGFSIQREPALHYYCLYGTEGLLESGRAEGLPDCGFFASDPASRGPAPDPVPPWECAAPPEASLGGHGEAEWFMVHDFLESIRQGTPEPLDVYASLDMSLPGLCAHLSAERGGAPVEVPDFRPVPGDPQKES